MGVGGYEGLPPDLWFLSSHTDSSKTTSQELPLVDDVFVVFQIFEPPS
jgi:hypothetical protein